MCCYRLVGNCWNALFREEARSRENRDLEPYVRLILSSLGMSFGLTTFFFFLSLAKTSDLR